MQDLNWVDERVRGFMGEEPELAWLLYRLPGLLAEGAHAQVEAAADAALERLRRRNDAWGELLVRRLRLEDRLARLAARLAVPEAEALAEFAHTPDTLDCPDAPLAVVLLCRAWAARDGRGWAPERLERAEFALDDLYAEALGERELAAERARALLDLGRAEEALEGLGALARVEPGVWDAARPARVAALLALGRAGEALEQLAGAGGDGAPEAERLGLEVDRAQALARLGRLDEALAALPAVEVAHQHPTIWGRFAEAVRLLLAAGRLAWDVGTYDLLLGWAVQLRDRGAAGPALELGLGLAELCLGHDAVGLGECALDVLTPALAELRDPTPGREALEALRARLVRARPPRLSSPEELRRRVQAGGVGFTEVLLAAHQWPEDADQARTAADFLGARRLHAHAVVLLERALAAQPRRLDLAFALADAALAAGDHARLDALVAAWQPLGGEYAVLALWTEARRRQDDPERGSPIEPMLQAVALAPDRPSLRARLAAELTGAARLDEALAQLEAALRLPGADPDLRWDLARLATRLGRWGQVRAVSAALGLPVEPGEHPIDERWGLCQVQYPGSAAPLYAVRTGPVTARVLQLSPPDEPCRLDDRVVFNPAPLNRPASGEDAPRAWVYPVDAVLSPGGWHTWVLDGVHPGPEGWEHTSQRLESEGYRVQVFSPPSYTVRQPWTGEDLPGVMALVGVPPTRTPAALAELLGQLADDPEAPLVFTELLEATGDTEGAAEHRRLAREWGL